MTIVEEIDDVIFKHFGIRQFGIYPDPRHWALMILQSDLNDTLTFNVSEDAQALEDLLRHTRATLRGIEGLTIATRRFTPAKHAGWVIRNSIDGQERDVFLEAEQALMNLEAWIEGMFEHSAFKAQARKSRNWRAASVAAMCRTVWAAAHWELAGRRPPTKTQNILAYPFGTYAAPTEADNRLRAEYDAFLRDFAPKSEKHDAPGPFGRFLEDVFAALGIFGKEGNPFPAASALRSLADASQQFQKKN